MLQKTAAMPLLVAAGLLGLAALGHAAPESWAVVGDVRIQALSTTLLRIEPKGPKGFEDATTFMVVNRDFPGLPIVVGEHPEGVLLKTKAYSVLLRTSPPMPTCSSPAKDMDANGAQRSVQFPNGVAAADRSECCSKCESDETCIAWVYAAGQASTNCWPLLSFSTTQSQSPGREFGYSSRGSPPGAATDFVVMSPDGNVLYESKLDKNEAPNHLHWPSPLQTPAYALIDHPRFVVPSWAVAPIPQGAPVEPDLIATHGYDFRNNVGGDTYLFLLGSTLQEWSSSRADFLRLAGPTPLLPDFAYGTWFTYWHSYTEAEAKDDVDHWTDGKFPLDVWALDMNWRKTDNHTDWYYDHPNTNLFPNFTEWFAYLRSKKLRTYFNDHPYPVAARNAGGLQTSPEETSFRWAGLSDWMTKGLTFWWFDHNWGFSIPPPFVNTSQSDGNWEGLVNTAWGSHVYYTTVEQFDRRVCDHDGDTFYGGRPITLTKFAPPDWRAGMDAKGHAETPAHHRYPVWWTGDGVTLQASVESMVDSGLHDFKPHVHSDCGGDYRGSGGDLLRWAAHCAFGSILRFHGDDHRPWTYDAQVQDTFRHYLNVRYKLLPSLIAAGVRATRTGFPLVARGDFYWPELHQESSSNQQYVFLDDLLVAPIFDSSVNVTTRSVWIPPGDWEDVWDGSIVTGPKTILARQPYEKQPMWYRRDGGLFALADAPAVRVEEQDWSQLTLDVFPSQSKHVTTKYVYERSSSGAAGASTEIVLRTDSSASTPSGATTVRLDIAACPEGIRSWALRFHLRPGQTVTSVWVDGQAVEGLLILPPSSDVKVFPFGGVGSVPAENAGPVAELHLSAESSARHVAIQLSSAAEVVTLV